MKKLLCVLFCGVTSLSFASSKLDMNTNPLVCGGKKLTNASTYANFQGCKSFASTPKKYDGMDGYKVTFSDDSGKSYKCFFPSNAATAVAKGCKPE